MYDNMMYLALQRAQNRKPAENSAGRSIYLKLRFYLLRTTERIPHKPFY